MEEEKTHFHYQHIEKTFYDNLSSSFLALTPDPRWYLITIS